MRRLHPNNEALWKRLQRHLDRTDGLSVIFLTSPDSRASEEFKRRLGRQSSYHSSQVETFQPFSDPQWPQHLLARLRETDPVAIGAKSTLWVELNLVPPGVAEEEAQQLREAVLGALNLGRTDLEKRFRRPLVLVLPQGWLPRVWQRAPDLWTVRGFVGELAVQAVPSVGAQMELAGLPILSGGDEPGGLPPAAQEWLRLADVAANEPDRVDAMLGMDAVQELRAAGQGQLALKVARSAVVLARHKATARSRPSAQRDLLTALDTLGHAAIDTAHYQEADEAWQACLRQALRLRRSPGSVRFATIHAARAWTGRSGIAARLGRTDLALRRQRRAVVWMEYLAREESDQESQRYYADAVRLLANCLQAAGDELAAYEASQLAVRLFASLPGAALAEPNSQFELAWAYLSAGSLAGRVGDFGTAKAQLRHGLELAKAANAPTRLGAQMARATAFAHSSLGHLAREEGNLTEGAQEYVLALDAARDSVARTNGSTEALRDQAICCTGLARVEHESSRADAAVAHLRQAVALYDRAAATAGESPQSLADLVASLDLLAQVERQMGDAAAAAGHAERAALLGARLRRLARTIP